DPAWWPFGCAACGRTRNGAAYQIVRGSARQIAHGACPRALALDAVSSSNSREPAEQMPRTVHNEASTVRQTWCSALNRTNDRRDSVLNCTPWPGPPGGRATGHHGRRCRVSFEKNAVGARSGARGRKFAPPGFEKHEGSVVRAAGQVGLDLELVVQDHAQQGT